MGMYRFTLIMTVQVHASLIPAAQIDPHTRPALPHLQALQGDHVEDFLTRRVSGSYSDYHYG
jgi:hypothetical protein